MERTVILNDSNDVQTLFGRYDQNITLIEEDLKIKVTRSNNGLKINGPDDQVMKAVDLFDYLTGLLDQGVEVKRRDVVYALKLANSEANQDQEPVIKRMAKEKIDVSIKGQLITPKTKGQIEYVEAIKQNDIVFGVGPAGTGKTFLAMAMAVNAFKKGLVRRIVLTRPAIEAGESLGFLPGDMIEKVSPYLRPLYDALYDMMEPKKVEELTEQGIIEVAPLAFMRGRTLNDSFVILDEAQNSTPFQMKMFLTRLGFDSKTVITGDPTQSDLPTGEKNGLVDVEEVLKDIAGIKFIHLTGTDVVRHELVHRIIQAYEHHSKS